MVQLEEIIQRDTRVNFSKNDMEGYKVAGNAMYNKEDQLVNANGEIRDMNDAYIARFTIYGEGVNARISLSDSLPEMLSEAVWVAQTTLSDLNAIHP